MDRKIVSQSVYSETYYSEEFKLSDFLAVIHDGISKGATHIRLESDSSVEMSLYLERPENDKEYNDRVSHEVYMNNFRLEQERKEYERLKQKFGE